MKIKEMLMAGASVLLFSGCVTETTSCLARGTRVKTPRGWRRIEELGIGDEVYAFDHETGELVETVVTATRSVRREVVALEFGGGGLNVTSDHPIYSPERGEYRPAGDWVTGEVSMLLGSDASSVELTDSKHFAGLAEVFDITVEHELHNFIAEGVVVHNKSPIITCDLNGEEVQEYTACDCEDGSEGTIVCNTQEAECFCEGDPGTDMGTDAGESPDSGAADMGSNDPDAGDSDAGSADGG